ncbi:hypothetical protein D3C76_1313530 [compost metagenome]
MSIRIMIAEHSGPLHPRLCCRPDSLPIGGEGVAAGLAVDHVAGKYYQIRLLQLDYPLHQSVGLLVPQLTIFPVNIRKLHNGKSSIFPKLQHVCLSPSRACLKNRLRFQTHWFLPLYSWTGRMKISFFSTGCTGVFAQAGRKKQGCSNK